MKIETNEEADRILTEARGLCSHEWNIIDNKEAHCEICNVYCTLKHLHTNPSPTTSWADYGEVIEWAKKQEWFKDFTFRLKVKCQGAWFKLPNNTDKNETEIMTDPEKGSHALAEFINERKVSDE